MATNMAVKTDICYISADSLATKTNKKVDFYNFEVGKSKPCSENTQHVQFSKMEANMAAKTDIYISQLISQLEK